MPQKKITLEDLARMTQAGFESAAQINDGRFKITIDEFERIRSNIRDIKTTLGPLVRSVVIMERDFSELSDLPVRVGVLERRVGVEK